jgi:PAS domain S-box-containing protein
MKSYAEKLPVNLMKYIPLDKRATGFIVLICGVLFTLLFAILFVSNPDIFKVIDRVNYSFLLKNLPENSSVKRPVIIDIDEKSLAKYGQWPWPRYLVSRLLDKIVALKPSVISLDMIFSEPDRTSVSSVAKGLRGFYGIELDLNNIPDRIKDNDINLADVLNKGPFILSHQFRFGQKKEGQKPFLTNPFRVSFIHNKSDTKEVCTIPESYSVLSNLKLFYENSEASGFSNSVADDDGILRRIPLLIRYHGQIYPSLALASVLKYKNINNIALKIENGVLQSISYTGTMIPVDPQGNLMIRFHDPEMSYDYFSASDILDGALAPDKLEGRIAFVGASAYGLESFQTTPLGLVYTGVEVHATVTDNLLSGNFISSPEWLKGGILLFILILGIVLSFTVSYRSNTFSIFIVLASICAILLFSQQMLSRSGIYIETAFPVITAIFIYLFLTIFKYFLEKMRAENALKESEKRFRNLFKKAPVPMCYISRDNKVLDINNSFTDITGYTSDEIQKLPDAMNILFENSEDVNNGISKWISGLKPATADNHSPESRECQVRCRDNRIITMLVDAEPVGDSFIVSLFDITERKQAEAQRAKLQAQHYQAQKLEAIGSLAGGIAHDFNNMLSIIIGYAELSIMQAKPGVVVDENLYKILDAAKHSARLTRQLLDFARKQMINPIPIDLNKSIEGSLDMICRLIGENIDLEWRPCKDSCTVMMDPPQLDQVLLNLCVNARDAIRDVGRIIIELSINKMDKNLNDSGFDIKTGEYVSLSISDNGCGMDEEVLKHIFEPFFTTKELGLGTGMGLATVYGIVRQNKGTVMVNSMPGKGSTFKILLPRHFESVTTLEKSEKRVTKGNNETILIVEDEPSILELIKTMLEAYKYRVLDAASPEQAINMACTNDQIVLLITDMVMPGMGGRDLADKILEILPDIKILFMSGYANNISSIGNSNGKRINFIQKPFTMKDMAIKIREVLDHNQ